MTTLLEALTKINVEGSRIDPSRVRQLRGHLQSAFGTSFVLHPDEVKELPSRLMRYLHNKVAWSTANSLASRLRTLLALGIDQGVIPTAPSFSPGFPEVLRPAAGPDERRWIAFQVFRRWCETEAIDFKDLTIEVFVRFRGDLLGTKSKSRAASIYTDVKRHWREMAEQGLFPILAIPPFGGERRDALSLRESEWPEAIQREFCAVSVTLADPLRLDLRGRRRQISERTIADYKRTLGALLRYASVVAKISIENQSLLEIVSSSDLVHGFIEWHRDTRCGGEERSYHSGWLCKFALLSRVLGGPEINWKEYQKSAKSINPIRVRMPFPERPITVEEFLNASRRALDAAWARWRALTSDSGPGERRGAAIQCRDALTFAVMVCRPVRSVNIRSMRFGRHLTRKVSCWEISFPGHEIKSRRPHRESLPGFLTSFLDSYFQSVVHTLTSGGEPAIVFPTKSGRPMRHKALNSRLAQIGSQSLGIHLSAHTLRHLIPTAYLLERPAGALEMQRLLGHQNLTTTIKHYVATYSQVASRRAAQFVRETCPHMVKLGELFRDSPVEPDPRSDHS